MVVSYYERLLEDAHEATGQRPRIKRIRLGDKSVELVFSNPQLENCLFPALAHLRAPDVDDITSLRVYVWDSKSSGLELPIPESELNNPRTQLGEGPGTKSRDAIAVAPKILYTPAPNENLFAFHPETRTALYWYRDTEGIPYYERGAPFRLLFDFWLAQEKLLLTHAGAVGNEHGGAFLVGKGGRGKSTSAISCLSSNTLGYLADD